MAKAPKAPWRVAILTMVPAYVGDLIGAVRVAGHEPAVVITVAKSIAYNVERAEKFANWSGVRVTLPYPGRWHRHRAVFLKGLTPVLRNLGPPANSRR